MDKKCFKCGETKALSEYYKHPRMGDGHLGKCKECTKKDSKNQWSKNIKDPEFVESEKERALGKYYRLYRKCKKPKGHYNKTSKSYKEMYPEKHKAKNASQHIPSEGGHNHHWSYRDEHHKDVINLPMKDHYKAHRFMIYDQERMMYRSLDGKLLDTREKHEAYIFDKIRNEED